MNVPRVPGWAFVAAVQARVSSLYRGIFRRDEVEHAMRDEFAHHLALRTEALVAQGVAPTDAAKQARVEFGHVDSHRADARIAGGLRWFDQIRFSWLDVKLGLRMLTKNPLLTGAAIFALAVGIPVGLAPSHLAGALAAPLPGDTENRVRAIRFWDPLTSSVAGTTGDDFEYWSRHLESFSALAAYRTVSFGIGATDGYVQPAAGAQLSVQTFPVLGIAPLKGRTFNATDAESGAPDVVVLGYDLWTSRFGSNPDVIGRSIRVGNVQATVIGVMPKGFRFPTFQQFWIPLRDLAPTLNRPTVRVQVVGRLASGVSAERAQAELQSVRVPPPANAAESEQRERLRAQVVPFGFLYLALPSGGLDALPEYYLIQVLTLGVLLVACGNVALLVFARTATRFRELAIRTALGASRSRIVSQIFVEALVLAVVAAGVGVFSINWLLGHVNLARIAGGSELPYWLTLSVTSETAGRALLLAALSATVAGVVPALGITGRGVYRNMGGKSTLRFGKVTSTLVVLDIAAAVIAVGLSVSMIGRATSLRDNAQAAGIPTAEYLAVDLTRLDRREGGSPEEQRNAVTARATAQTAFTTALRAEPGVTGVAIGDVLPQMEHRSRPVEVLGGAKAPDAPPKWVRYANVDVEFFRELGQAVLAGRDFVSSDADAGHAVIVVNAPFVEEVLGGGEAIGRRVRFSGYGGSGDTAWREIVGVVRHLGVNMLNAEHGAGVYVPVSPGQLNPMRVGVHLQMASANAAPIQLTKRVRELALAADPDYVVGNAVMLSTVRQGDWYVVVGIGAGLSVLAAVLVALAGSGLYALLSLSVSERTREIGIRAALGATRGALVMTILRRSLTQIGVGALVGAPIAAWMVSTLWGDASSRTPTLFSLLVALGAAGGILLLVGIVACLVPARRVLAINAREAMQAE